MGRIVDAAAANADIVVFDAGPLLESASTIELTHLVDVVVLAVPTKHQRIDELTTVSRQLQARRDALLPVDMPTSSRFSFGTRSPRRPKSTIASSSSSSSANDIVDGPFVDNDSDNAKVPDDVVR
jgi:hypothetical protein